MSGHSPLTAQQHEILAFERRWWRLAGAKESAVRAALGLSVDDYYRTLNALLDHPGALEADPLLVRRLRRQRSRRQESRSALRRTTAVG